MKEDAIFNRITLEVETQLEFKNTRLICQSDVYSFIPNAFFQPETASDYLYFEHTKKDSDTVNFKQLPAWESTLIYALPQNLCNALSRIYPLQTIEHHLDSFLSKTVKHTKEPVISVWMRNKIMDAALVINGKLSLLNSYAYNSSEDFVFFVLNIFEQLSLDTEVCKVQIYNAGKNTEIKKLLQKYVKEVTISTE